MPSRAPAKHAARKRPETLSSIASERLSKVEGAEAAFLSGSGADRSIIVVAREHGIMSRRDLLKIEDELSARFGEIEICVRAHQGRGLESFKGLSKIF